MRKRTAAAKTLDKRGGLWQSSPGMIRKYLSLIIYSAPLILCAAAMAEPADGLVINYPPLTDYEFLARYGLAHAPGRSALAVVITLFWLFYPLARLLAGSPCGGFFGKQCARGANHLRSVMLAALIAAAVIVNGTGKNSVPDILSGSNTVTTTTHSSGGVPASVKNTSSSASLRTQITPPGYVIGDLPAWWQSLYPAETNLCENGCGIPVFWHKITRFDHALYDCNDADRDADSLDEWSEWWLGSDPRSASTTGIFLDDGWLFENGFDILDPSAAFLPSSNGLLTVAESIQFGVDPDDPAPIPPVILPGNGANAVTYTLSAPIPEGAVAVLTLDGQRRPLTHTNVSVTVLFPDNVLFPFTFDPPEGFEDIRLTLSGNLRGFFVHDPAGVFDRPGSPKRGEMSAMGGEPGKNGTIASFGVTQAVAVVHLSGEQAGFAVTGLSSTAAAEVTWAAADGASRGMFLAPAKGERATFEADGSTTVFASLSTEDGSVTAEAKVHHCVVLPLGVGLDVTDGYGHPVNSFSPHLGETLDICGEWHPGYCEHNPVKYADADLLVGVIDKNGAWQQMTMPFKFQDVRLETNRHAFTNWDGAASGGLVELPGVFTQGPQPFSPVRGAFSDKVPPPYFYIAAQVKSNGIVVAAVTNKIYVPQVVSVTLDDWVIHNLTSPLDCITNAATSASVRLYDGCEFEDIMAAFKGLPGKIQAKFPPDANILVRVPEAGEYPVGHRLEIKTGLAANGTAFGETFTSEVNERNAFHTYFAAVYPQGIRNALEEEYKHFIAGTLPNGATTSTYTNLWKLLDPPKITLNQFMDIIAEVGAHEIGHEVGLVSMNLGGNVGGHYTSSMPQHIMNDGRLTPLMWYLGKPAIRQFRPLDSDYLKFILPKGP